MSIEETCWTVVRRAADGDTEARGEFAETYLAIVRAYLASRWRTSPLLDLLDDAVQEVFLDFFRHDGALQRVEGGSGRRFRAFLFAVTEKVALRYERRTAKERGRRAPADPAWLASDDETMAAAFDRAWAKHVMRRAADRQAATASTANRRRRVEILRLRFREGLPVREIAKRLDEDPACVHHEYAKARDEFKACLRAEVMRFCDGSAEDVDRECRALLGLLA